MGQAHDAQGGKGGRYEGGADREAVSQRPRERHLRERLAAPYGDLVQGADTRQCVLASSFGDSEPS